jgi:hypothetical protein
MDRIVGDLHQPNLLFEAQDQSRGEFILKAGLASDPRKLVYYRRVLANPKGAPQDPVLRGPAGDVLKTLLDILFSDTQVWNRVKTILMRKRTFTGLREDITDSGLRALIEKSLQHEIPLEVILEVYSRGAEQGSENDGFGRVNSFIAGGKAARLDEDLIVPEEPIVERKTNVLSTVQRVLKEKKQ